MTPLPLALLRTAVLALALAAMTPTALAAEPVRGAWVAGPQHNRFWDSRATMREALQTMKRAGLNSVYVVALGQGRTLYPSERMAQLTGHAQLEALQARDAWQELLEEAGAQGLRVVAWLELGFASHHGPVPSAGLLQVRPGWAALGRDGHPVSKNGFHWMNAFDPEVQQLCIDLSVEMLRRYPTLAGVQGDDRLPASPSTAGYHPDVLAKYGWQPGAPLPEAQDAAWVQFRAGLLTEFLHRWRTAVKAVRSTAVLSLAPSPYPWSLQTYLQDWPTWMREGLVDELLPQLYRRNAADYAQLLQETRVWVPPGQLDRVFPGMLLALGPEVIPSATLLRQWLASTRAAGFRGEVQFHSGGIAPMEAVFLAAYGDGPGTEAAKAPSER